jgi:hypothetical protein
VIVYILVFSKMDDITFGRYVCGSRCV